MVRKRNEYFSLKKYERDVRERDVRRGKEKRKTTHPKQRKEKEKN
jgi:hypothetical protein